MYYQYKLEDEYVLTLPKRVRQLSTEQLHKKTRIAFGDRSIVLLPVVKQEGHRFLLNNYSF